MKKITYFVLLASIAVGAQSGLVQDSGQQAPISQRAAQAVIFDQPPGAGAGTGIVSDVFNGIPGAVYSTDDFTIDIDEENIVLVETITVFGFQSAGNLLTAIEGFDLFIYADNGGVPAGDPSGGGDAALLAIENLAPDDASLTITETIPSDPAVANSYDFTVDIAEATGEDFSLEGGVYWIIAAPRIGANATNSPERWNWFDAGVANAGSEAHLIDPDDLFGAGATAWTPFSSLGLAFGSVAFTIEGTETLSTDNIDITGFSLFPNPTNGIFSIGSTEGQLPTRAIVYDLLGKQVQSFTADFQELDITALSSGLYIVEVYGANNTKTTRKVLKQ